MKLTALFNTAIDKACELYDRFKAHAATARAEQQAFQDKLSAAAGVLGIENVERLMAGKAPVHPVNVWPEIEERNKARKAAADAAEARRKERGPWIIVVPYEGSARHAQDRFNKIANAYVEKYGIEAFEKAMNPPKPPRPPLFVRPPDTFD
jgi:hypothetical protein